MKLSFALFLACWLSFSANDCVAALTSNLQGYWTFDGSGQDTSGSGRNLDVVGGAGFSPGLIGQSLSLAGNASQFAVGQGNETVFNLGGDDFTIQVWANFNSLAGEQILFEKFTGGAGPGYTVTKLAGNNILFFGAGAGAINSVSSVAAAGNWNHIVVRRDATQFEMFLNGLSVGSLVTANAVSTSPNSLLIGERDGGQTFPVNGNIDEVAFWNRSLSDIEIGMLFNDGAGMSVSAVPEPAALPILTTAFVCIVRRRGRRTQV